MDVILPKMTRIVTDPFHPIDVLVELSFPALSQPVGTCSKGIPTKRFFASMLLVAGSTLIVSVFLINFGVRFLIISLVQSAFLRGWKYHSTSVVHVQASDQFPTKRVCQLHGGSIIGLSRWAMPVNHLFFIK